MSEEKVSAQLGLSDGDPRAASVAGRNGRGESLLYTRCYNTAAITNRLIQ